MPVGEQVAVLYLGVNGLLKSVPLEKVDEFETAFLERLRAAHRKDVIDALETSGIDEKIEKIIRETAAQVAKQF